MSNGYMHQVSNNGGGVGVEVDTQIQNLISKSTEAHSPRSKTTLSSRGPLPPSQVSETRVSIVRGGTPRGPNTMAIRPGLEKKPSRCTRGSLDHMCCGWRDK